MTLSKEAQARRDLKSQPVKEVVWGVWDHGWDYDDLVGLFARRVDAEEFARRRRKDLPPWDVEPEDVR